MRKIQKDYWQSRISKVVNIVFKRAFENEVEIFWSGLYLWPTYCYQVHCVLK